MAESGAAEVDPSRQPSTIHDVWGIGVVTSAFADGYRGIITSHPPDENIQSTFKKFATKGNIQNARKLAGALRDLGKSERQVQRLTDSVREFPMNEEAFTELVKPSGHPYYVPVLGHTMSFAGHLVAEPMDGYGRSSYQSSVPREPVIGAIFAEADVNKDGKLDEHELHEVLRRRGYTHQTIDEICARESVQKRGGMTLYEFKQVIRGPKYSEGTMNYVPYVGPRIHSHIIGDDEIPEEDVKEAWDHVAYVKGKKELDKEGVEQVLAELGKNDYEKSRLIVVPEDEAAAKKQTWTYDQFKVILFGEPPVEEKAGEPAKGGWSLFGRSN